MYISTKHSILLRNFKFSRDLLKINEGDEIELLIGKNEFLYKKITTQKSYIIFQIMNEKEDEEELDTSNKLYEKEKYSFKFDISGSYLVTVLNHPNLYLKVNVNSTTSQNKLISSKNLNSMKTKEHTMIDKSVSDKNSFFSKEIKNFTFNTSTTNNNNDCFQENDFPLLIDRETSISTFSKIIKTFKINKHKSDSLYKIYDNIKQFEFEKKKNFDIFMEDFWKKQDNPNIKINKDHLYNDIDNKFLNLIIK